jgi:hypothetical protein
MARAIDKPLEVLDEIRAGRDNERPVPAWDNTECRYPAMSLGRHDG